MNIIYLDTLFFVNFICDYLLLVCSGRLSGSHIHRWAIALASIIGGIYACLCVLSPAAWFTHPLIKCVCSIFMCVVSFWNEVHLFLCVGIFLLLSFAAGGIFSAMSISFQNRLYLPINLKTVLAAFLLFYGILTLFFRKLPLIQKRTYKQIHITLRGQSVTLTALHDTGNELYDPITNSPVVICCPTSLHPFFPDTNLQEQDTQTLYLKLSSLTPPLRSLKLIPYKTVSESGLMVGFRPDAIRVNGVREDLIIAISPFVFSNNEPYQAIY